MANIGPGIGIPTSMALALAAGAWLQVRPALASEANPYPRMAPISQYRVAAPAEEVALARSAAPPSVSDHADVLVLGDRGYTLAEKGSNGFVCIVERSWANDFDSPEFWNPKSRSPICFNRAAARSVLPAYLERTKWVLAGVPKAELIARAKSAIASGAFGPPEVGSMCFMMSKQGYLNDEGGHWHPHLMFFLPRTKAAEWGANLPGSPLFAADGALEPVTIFMSPVQKWSDGTPDAPHG
ncbi:MAG: hypothetical protein ACYDCL_07895 [Myxococcales bacterium]